jgi:hypothetical protein
LANIATLIRVPDLKGKLIAAPCESGSEAEAEALVNNKCCLVSRKATEVSQVTNGSLPGENPPSSVNFRYAKNPTDKKLTLGGRCAISIMAGKLFCFFGLASYVVFSTTR